MLRFAISRMPAACSITACAWHTISAPMGVTLTSFEADAHAALVVSSDVGSQASVVVPELLMPRAPLAFLQKAERTIATLLDDPDTTAELLDRQHERVSAFAGLPDARDWTRNLYERWAS